MEVAIIKRSILLGLCILIVFAGYIRFAGTNRYEKLRIEYFGENNELINKFETIGSTVLYVNSFQEFSADSDVYLIDGQKLNTLDRAAFLAFLKDNKKVYFLNLSSARELSIKFLDEKSYENLGKDDSRTLLRLYYNDDNKLTMLKENYSGYTDLYKIFINPDK